jgi:hypothetical protein
VSTLADIYAEIPQGFTMFIDAISGCIRIQDGFQFTHTSGIVEFSELPNGPKIG